MGEGILRFDASMKRKPRHIPKSLLPLKDEGFLKAYYSANEIRKLVLPNADLITKLDLDEEAAK